MKRTILCAALALLVAAPAAADVTIKLQQTGKGIGKAAEAPAVTYIKGHRMRQDQTLNDTPMTTIIDVDGQKFISINHKKKEAEVYDMTQFRQSLDKATQGASIEASMKPNGQTKTIAGRECTGYDVSIAMPMAAGADMRLVMSGPACIAKGAPGAEDFKAFYLAAAEKGFVMSDPRAAKGAPQQTKGMTELYKSLADAGLPYEMSMSIKVEGGGPMAGMMNRMFNNSAFTQTVTEVATGAIGDDVFAIPAGYKVKDAK
ncbi:MAG TPA: hypothetical protein VF198_00015 [Vicinamibacterales bacterium]